MRSTQADWKKERGGEEGEGKVHRNGAFDLYDRGRRRRRRRRRRSRRKKRRRGWYDKESL